MDIVLNCVYLRVRDNLLLITKIETGEFIFLKTTYRIRIIDGISIATMGEGLKSP